MPTGATFEEIIVPALETNGYRLNNRNRGGKTKIGVKPSGHNHLVDAWIETGDRRILLSCKWQQDNGTTEDKIPYEIIILKNACENYKPKYDMAYLILGGPNRKKGRKGWALKEWYLNGGLEDLMIDYTETVKIISLEDFIVLCNKKEL